MVFLFLKFVLAPTLVVIIVTGCGFCVWRYQLIAGPPSV
jgi:nitrate reductase NapE component